MKPFIIPALAVLSLATLAGCGSDDSVGPQMFCPQEAVLQQASTLTAFLPGRNDVASQITTAQITGVAGSCDVTDDNQTLTIKLQTGFRASNGPANHGAKLTLPYFVALTQGDDIIAKTDYSIAINFDGNVSTAQATSKPVKITLPNTHPSGHLQILVGFELTPDQLTYAAAHPIPGQ